MYCVGKGIILLLIVGGVFILGAAVPENDDELIAGASCKNNGECRNDGVCGTKKVCECKEGWTGAYCENIRGCDWLKCDTKISNCIFDQTTKNAKCQCKENNKVYMDNRCIASCWNDMECLNSGYCNVYKVCRCREGSSGDHCEIVDGCEDLKCDTKISNCSLNVEAEKGMCQCKDDKKLYVNNKCVTACSDDDECQNGGICGYDKMCECRNGTKGDFCELIVGCQELNCDAETSNCILNDETHTGMCICKEDNKLYFDNKCVLDSCLSNPCRNGGTCGIAKDGFRCVCKPPYSGTLCENDPCSRNPCQNGGICRVKGDSFKCLCKDVYFGDRCEKDPCTEKPCKNGGICEMAKYSFKCICRASFSGPTCEEDACTDNPCVNGGTCEQDGDSFKCKCRHPYSGKICESEINEITSEEPTVSLMTSSKLSTPTTEDYKNATKSTNSHFNETTYTYNWTTEEPIKSTYYLNTTYELFNFTRDMNTSTLSPKDITTDNILTTFEPESNETISDNTTETPTSITDITNRYNWTSNEPSNFTHFLNTTYYPYNTTMIVNVTTVRPGSCRRDSDCLNGGVCRRTSKYEYFCDCPPNFTGLWCEVNLCEGLDKLCHSMGAICKIIGRNAVCECPKNKIHNPESGICEDACDSQKCLHGSCEIVGRYYKCNCHEGYTGFHCDEVIKNKKENYIPWLIFVTAFLILLCLLFIGIFYLVCKIHLTVKRLKSRVHIN